MPSDWPIHQLAELWHVPPWVVAEAPAFWTQRALFYHRTKTQAENDRMENERRRHDAYHKARY